MPRCEGLQTEDGSMLHSKQGREAWHQQRQHAITAVPNTTEKSTVRQRLKHRVGEQNNREAMLSLT